MAVLNDENTKPVGDDVLPPADYSGIDPKTLDPNGPYANPSDKSLTFDGNVAPKTGDWVAAGGPLDDPNGGIDGTSPPGDPNQDVALYEGPQGAGPFVDDTPGDVPLAMLDPVSGGLKPTPVPKGLKDLDTGKETGSGGGAGGTGGTGGTGGGEGGSGGGTGGGGGRSSLWDLFRKAEKNIDARKFVDPDSGSPSTEVTDSLDQTDSALGGHIQDPLEIGLDQDLIGTLFGTSEDKLDSFSFMMPVHTNTPSDGPTNNQKADLSTPSDGPTDNQKADLTQQYGLDTSDGPSNNQIADLMQEYGLDNLDPGLNAMLGEQDFWAQGADQVAQQLTDLFSHVVLDPYKSDGIKESYDLIV